MTIALIILAVLCLAYANGANDNFKGVATLFGSGTTNYRRALSWATLTTLLGSLAAFLFAGQLLSAFRGLGLVSDTLAADVSYGAAVALGAGLTVLTATRLGMPISTTHSLVGALVGAGWAAGSAINLALLVNGFFLPLLLSPVIAVLFTGLLYPLLHRGRRRMGITEETCFCVGTQVVEVVPLIDSTAALKRAEILTMSVGDTVTCENRYNGTMFGLQAAGTLDRMHYLSAGVVSFARGLNDTPKIAALLLVAPQIGGLVGIALVGVTIAIGGLLSARKVAETMSLKLTTMNHGQGFTANVITGVIVIGASRLGMPVSTTHVSCGSLFGIGAVTGQGKPRMIATVLAAWLTTLPAGIALGALCYWAVTAITG